MPKKNDIPGRSEILIVVVQTTQILQTGHLPAHQVQAVLAVLEEAVAVAEALLEAGKYLKTDGSQRGAFLFST